MNFIERKKLLLSITKKAGQYIIDNQEKIKTAHYKNKKLDIVTDIDLTTERLIRNHIIRKFPRDGIIGEEFGSKPAASEFTWIVDPLDGTANYPIFIPFFCTSIAVLYRHQVVLGTVYDPVHKELFFAQKGRGAYLNGQRIVIRKKVSMKESMCSFGSCNLIEGAKIIARVIPHIRKPRYFGSTALAMAYTAKSRMQVYIINGINAWDIASGVLLVDEAGGMTRTFDNNPVIMNEGSKYNIVSGAKNIVEGIVKLI